MAGEIHFISEMRREPRFAPPNYALHITQRLDSSSGTCRPFIATPHRLLRAGYRKNPPGSQLGRGHPTETAPDRRRRTQRPLPLRQSAQVQALLRQPGPAGARRLRRARPFGGFPARPLGSRLVWWGRNLTGLEVAVGADDDFISLVVLGAEAGDLDTAASGEQRRVQLHRRRQKDLHFGAWAATQK